MIVYNTLTRQKESFEPLVSGAVRMYVCGPTVYDLAHLGHGRAAISMDIIRRYFLYKGFDVTYVSNITDVDDKIIKRAQEEGTTEAELAGRIIPEYDRDYTALNVLPPSHQPKCTEYITKMVALVERLLANGVAYRTDDGIYFEVEKCADYGKLSGQKLDELKAGARVEVDSNKKSPLDFALWKAAKEGEPEWDGPDDMKGRPGWHIECSAMSMDLLGESFDIHGGGIDLQFPHHECEIAQSETATGKPFAKYWLHNGHVTIRGEKMAKSLGNFTTLRDIYKKYDPLVVRYALLATHYRQPIDFTPDLLEQAKNSLSRLRDFMRALGRCSNGDANPNVALSCERARLDFQRAMDDDFEMSGALAAVFGLVKSVNMLIADGKMSAGDADGVLRTMRDFDRVLGVLEVSDEGLDEEVTGLIRERENARESGNYARGDEIRDELKERGIILEDTADGTVWKRG